MPTTTQTTLNYPRDFRTVPQFLLDVPEAWNVIEYPGALYAVSTVDPEQPWLNLVVGHERIVAGTHDVVFAARALVLAEAHADHAYELEEEMLYELTDDLFFARQSSWVDPVSGTRVRQLEMSTAAENRIGAAVNDIIDLTFLHPVDAAELYAGSVVDIIQSFRFA